MTNLQETIPEGYSIRPCDLTGRDDAVEAPYSRLYTNGQPLHICRETGFVYVRYRRSAEAIARAWSDEVYGDRYTARIPAVLARQMYAADFLDSCLNLKGEKVSDIGAGEGQFLEILRDRYGAEVFGIEPSQKNCDLMQKNGISSFAGTIEDYVASSDGREASVVTITWTLENCYSCMDMIRAAYDMLPVGGHVAIATGSRILVPFKKALWQYLGPAPADLHSFRFSKNTLSGLLALNGFEPVHVNRYLDSEYLVMIGRKAPEGTEIPWQRDDYRKVYNFFERWHHESVHYLDA